MRDGSGNSRFAIDRSRAQYEVHSLAPRAKGVTLVGGLSYFQNAIALRYKPVVCAQSLGSPLASALQQPQPGEVRVLAHAQPRNRLET